MYRNLLLLSKKKWSRIIDYISNDTDTGREKLVKEKVKKQNLNYNEFFTALRNPVNVIFLKVIKTFKYQNFRIWFTDYKKSNYK